MIERRRLLMTALVAAAFASAARGAENALELIMVEEHGCPWCARWNAEIGPIYPKTPEGRLAPLRRIDIADVTPGSLALESRVVFTPTFVLARGNAELGRIEGYPGDELFWWFLSSLMEDHGLKPEGE